MTTEVEAGETQSRRPGEPIDGFFTVLYRGRSILVNLYRQEDGSLRGWEHGNDREIKLRKTDILSIESSLGRKISARDARGLEMRSIIAKGKARRKRKGARTAQKSATS